MLRTSELDYQLPDDRVATHPAVPRDAARLMVLWRDEPGRVEHRLVSDLPEYLRAGDLIVVNTSRVVPARVVGERVDTRGGAEGLWLGEVGAKEGESSEFKPQSTKPEETELLWRVMVRARRVRPGVRIALFGRDGLPSGVVLRLLERSEEEGEEGAWVCAVEGVRNETAVGVLERIGHVPLPPYIRAARKRMSEGEDAANDLAEYQCVYADVAAAGSVAAPTAGLHFTPDLLVRIEAMGVRRAEVVLHVGTGTFKAVETEFVEEHSMHAEWCCVEAETARAIVETRAKGGRVVTVGTTTARVLESFGPAGELVERGAEGWSRLLITPGHSWKNVDVLMTNFHLPRSTLLALVAARLPGGVGQLLGAYREAIDRGYRFYSYGDAMIVL